MIKFFSKFINLFTFLIFMVIFFFSFIYSSNVYYSDNNILSIIFMFCTLIVWNILYWLIYKKIKLLNKKHEIIFLAVYFFIVSILQLTTIKQLAVEPNWDFGVVFNSAKGMANYGIRNFVGYPEYFQFFPNNILLFLLSTLFMKIGIIFNINAIHSAYIMNILFIDLAIFMLYLTIRNISGNKNAIFGLIISFSFVALFLYTPIVYSDTMSLFIPISFVFLYNVIKKKNDKSNKDYVIFGLMGLLVFMGKEMKVTSLIIFFAIIFDYLLNNFKFRKILNLLLCLFVFILAEFTFKVVFVNNEKYSFKVNNYGSIPITHWIMMGVEDNTRDNSGRNTYGGYNENDYKLTESFANGNEASKFNIQEFKKRVKQMGIFGYPNYLLKKSVNTWTDGYYFSNIKLSLKSLHSDSYLYNFLLVNDSSRDFMRSYVKGAQYALIIIIIIGSISKLLKKAEIDYLRLSLIGLFIFFLLWENRSRYIFNYIPIFILIIVDFYNNLKEKADNKKYLKYKNN